MTAMEMLSGWTSMPISFVSFIDGNNLVIQIPQKNGKPKNFNYKIFDHKWNDSSAK